MTKTSHNCQIKTIDRSDFAKVAKLERTLFEDAWSQADLDNLAKMAGFGAMGIFVGNKLVAYLLYQLLDVGEVLRIGVALSWQSQGLGGRLMSSWLKTLGCNAMLEVRADNEPAIALYRKLGFGIIHTRPNYYRLTGGAVDALIMQKVWIDG